MPSDLMASRASEWRATLARSSMSGWIEAVVVDRAAQGAPVQPAAVGAGEGVAAAPELRRRVRQPRRRGRPTSARRWSASWWAKRTRASYSGMARTGGSGSPGCSSGRRAWRWPGSSACLQSAPPRLVRRTQPPSPRTSTPGSRSSIHAEWDDGAVGGVGGGGSAPAPGARQAVPEEVGDDPIGGVGVVRLYGLGARKVVFNSLPPLGCIPSQRVHSGNGKCLDHVNGYAVEFNAAAKKLLNGMNDASPPLCPPPPGADALLPYSRRDAHFGAPPRSRWLSSGWLIADIANGYSKVTWVEHMEVEEKKFYRDLVLSDVAFGAHRWHAALQRACDRYASLVVLGVPHHIAGGMHTLHHAPIPDPKLRIGHDGRPEDGPQGGAAPASIARRSTAWHPLAAASTRAPAPLPHVKGERRKKKGSERERMTCGTHILVGSTIFFNDKWALHIFFNFNAT
uniref:START domain-containing protein n=1 Tax=Oryza meridionalis TaxID=40149 RepID=A0A0E0EI79_9ORYZ